MYSTMKKKTEKTNRIVMLLSSSDITGDITCLVLVTLQQWSRCSV